MYCRQCGKQISDDSQYCEFCGKQIIGETYSDRDEQHYFEVDDAVSTEYNHTFQENEIENENGGLNVYNENRNTTLQEQTTFIEASDLKEYINIVVDMEKNIYLQKSLISEMENRCAQLGKAHKFEEPVKVQTVFGGDIGAVIMGVSIFIGVFLLWLGLEYIDSCDVFFEINMLIGICVSTFGVGIGVGASAMLINYAKEKMKYDKEYKIYKENVRRDKKRIRKEKFEKKVLLSELQLIQEQNRDSKQHLERIYSLNIIFPKYRNLAMLCSIYEYLCSGRCSTLEGHEGAYNILEMEIRLDRIITQIDLVIERLESIQNNQYMLYSTVREINQQVDQLLQSTDYVMDSLQNFKGQAEDLVKRIDSAEKGSMLAAYQAESMQKELHYMNRMNYLSGKYDKVFYNMPPT